ncbi:MAG: hypothetical protein ABEJ90_04370 [Halobacterium sp.]
MRHQLSVLCGAWLLFALAFSLTAALLPTVVLPLAAATLVSALGTPALHLQLRRRNVTR